MSKTGEKPEKAGELNDFGGDASSMEEHKGAYDVKGSGNAVKGKGWHGFGKPVKK